MAIRNLVPHTRSEEKPFIARSAAHTAITTGRYRDNAPPMVAMPINERASGIRTNASTRPITNLRTLRNRDLGGLGGTGTKGFTPDDRSDHLLNFWGGG